MRYMAISVDAEADGRDKARNRISSISGIHFLQEISARYGMRPTYLVTYEMATSDEAVAAIRRYLDKGLCEIGHHLHVWTTPPFTDKNAYGVDERWIRGIQSELSDEIFDNKMSTLHEAIEKNYGRKPTAHRAGRWSIDKRTFAWLEKMGYLVDTSICPYMSWNSTRGVSGYIETDGYDAPNEPYYPDIKDLTKKAKDAKSAFKVLEVPVTGVKNGLLGSVRLKGMGRFISVLRKLGYKGARNSSFRPDCRLRRNVFERFVHSVFDTETPFINFMFHSSELALGASPYTIESSGLEIMKGQIEYVLRTAQSYGVKGITLSEIASHICKTP